MKGLGCPAKDFEFYYQQQGHNESILCFRITLGGGGGWVSVENRNGTEEREQVDVHPGETTSSQATNVY